jgi:hypothetical protein
MLNLSIWVIYKNIFTVSRTYFIDYHDIEPFWQIIKDDYAWRNMETKNLASKYETSKTLMKFKNSAGNSSGSNFAALPYEWI